MIKDNSFIVADCLDILRDMPDKAVDLCLTDPPYGIGEAAGKNKSRGRLAVAKDYGNLDWDNWPMADEESAATRRVSDKQIFWGGNFFNLPPSSCWLVWDKDNGAIDFADCELAWTNYTSAVRMFKYRWHGMLQEPGHEKELRYHPTQKPVALFVWCLENYSNPGDLILDPFCGSGTTAIACHRTGRRFICIDKEQKYIDIAKRRYADITEHDKQFKKYTSQKKSTPLCMDCYYDNKSKNPCEECQKEKIRKPYFKPKEI
jgi:DNA modification methylase